MGCSKKHFILSQWSSTCMMTFSEGAKSCFTKIKSTVRKICSKHNGLLDLKYHSEDKPHGAGEYLSQQKVGRSMKTVFIMSWDDSVGHCWFLFTFHWPSALQSSLFSCDLQPREHAGCHPLSPVLDNWYTQEKKAIYTEKCPSNYSSLNYLFSHFVLIKFTGVGVLV